VRLNLHVAAPPQKPLLIFDGDCNFCTVWVRRWQHETEGWVDYIPFQDESVGRRFPELPRERFETAVHLVETDGTVYSGAEAAFRALNHSDNGSVLFDWYLRWPAFARLTEACYRFVAGHRQFFSILTRLAWGQHLEPASYLLVRTTFLKSLGAIYFIAFVSLWFQVTGLIGSSGILPANLTMFGLRQEANASHMGWRKYQALPTLCWLSATDGFLKAQCAAGTGLAVLVILGIAPAPCLFLLWLIYLSLAGVSREFLSFQWDALLLETGFLAIFFAPVQWLPRRANTPPPSKLVVWLLRWLLFRLMLGSGLVKLLSGDPTWKNLTALKYHYETQPLPTWIGWYAHQLPLRLQQVSTFLLFAVELVLPFLIFTPRRLRRIPCVGFIFLQILIMLTGNYCFFNLLSILLCLLLLDDVALAGLVPNRWRGFLKPAAQETSGPQSSGNTVEDSTTPKHAAPPVRHRWPIQVTLPLTCIAILIPTMQFAALLRLRVPWPGPLLSAYSWVSPFRSFNNYGLFAIMTTNRLEIVVQGSNDGVKWLDYEFKYKPGDPNHRPRFVEPHQPRLDWQMWFAALGDYQHNFWFVEFCVRLLNGSHEVLHLLKNNPFPDGPPRYLRAVVYEYHFTDPATRKRTGAWWRREFKGNYLPVISRRTEGK
jgi:predicted DCC family thiol-disulfide oxidoreductase YuxK